ncbi:hypothetical protein LJU32_07700 [Pseudomonas sp. B21_DOA]|nr:hypothetical protein LJU32_07700 [Pseudomonas sp. B21_DOA]
MFKTSSNQVERLYTPVLQRAGYATDPVAKRAKLFMQRFRQKPLQQDASGAVVDQGGRLATAELIQGQAFSLVSLS